MEAAGTSAAQEVPRGLLGYMWCREMGREMEEEEQQMPGRLPQAQLEMLEEVAYPFSRGSFQPRNRTGSPTLQADSLAIKLPWKTTSKGYIHIF